MWKKTPCYSYTGTSFGLFRVKKARELHLMRTTKQWVISLISTHSRPSPACSWRRRSQGWWPCSSWPARRGWCWPRAWSVPAARRWPSGPWCRRAASTRGSRPPWSPPWTTRAARASYSGMRWSRSPGRSEGKRAKKWAGKWHQSVWLSFPFWE